MGRWQQATLARAFLAWREGAADQQAKVAKLLEAAKRWHQPLLADAFGSWREAVWKGKALFKAAAFLRSQATARAFLVGGEAC